MEEVIAERRADVDATTLQVRRALAGYLQPPCCFRVQPAAMLGTHCLTRVSHEDIVWCIERACTMLSASQLLERRIEAARQVEKRPDVVEGLQLLYRRWGSAAHWAPVLPLPGPGQRP